MTSFSVTICAKHRELRCIGNAQLCTTAIKISFIGVMIPALHAVLSLTVLLLLFGLDTRGAAPGGGGELRCVNEAPSSCRL